MCFHLKRKFREVVMEGRGKGERERERERERKGGTEEVRERVTMNNKEWMCAFI